MALYTLLVLLAVGNVAYGLSRYVFFGRMVPAIDAWRSVLQFRELVSSLGFLSAFDTVFTFTVHSVAAPLLWVSAAGFLFRNRLFGLWAANVYCVLCFAQFAVSYLRDRAFGPVLTQFLFVFYPLLLFAVLNLVLRREFHAPRA